MPRRQRRRAQPAPAHDHEVHASLRHVGDGEPEVLGECSGTGPAQDLAGGDHDRHVGRFDLELLEQGLHLRIGVGVKPPVGQAGSRQELPDLEGLG